MWPSARWRWWPIGLAVAVVTVVVGMVLTWETPRVFVSRATVFPPVSVANAVAGQRYINDMQAAINSFTVRDEVAEELGVPRSAFGDQVEVRRIRQSTVMDVIMQSPDELPDPSQALNTLVERAALSLAAPEVAAAEAQRTRAADGGRRRGGRGGRGQGRRVPPSWRSGTPSPPPASSRARPPSWPTCGCAPRAPSSSPAPTPTRARPRWRGCRSRSRSWHRPTTSWPPSIVSWPRPRARWPRPARILREAEAAAIRAESGPTVEIAQRRRRGVPASWLAAPRRSPSSAGLSCSGSR